MSKAALQESVHGLEAVKAKVLGTMRTMPAREWAAGTMATATRTSKGAEGGRTVETLTAGPLERSYA